MSVDHVSLPVPHSLVDAEVTFLNASLEPLGIKELFRVAPAVVGMGTSMTNPFLWVAGVNSKQEPLKEGSGNAIHLAFKAKDRKQVDDFHTAALKAGGKDNGAPGIRKDYHPGYYGAFVIDPAGHNIEVVIHETPEEGGREKTADLNAV